MSVDAFGTAIYLVTLPESVTDPLGNSVAVNISGEFAISLYTDLVRSSTPEYLLTQAGKVSANTFNVYVRDFDGGGNSGHSYTTFRILYR
jgi:hypothetical protein